jgi:MFS superfamily sulfate permease-like transporter
MSVSIAAPARRSAITPSFVADLRAAFTVFLIALPLTLGIAHAVGASPTAGLMAGVIGGLVVGSLSGSELVVSGPAAGLIVLAATGLARLGVTGFALAVALAGLLQVLLGALGMGRLAQFFPSSVVRAMLSAIGLVLVLKQLPHALGYDADFEGDPEFMQLDGENTLSSLVHAFRVLHPGALLISVLTLGALFTWRVPALGRLRRVVPPELVAVLVGSLASAFLPPELALSEEHRLSLPHWSSALTPHAASFPLALLGSAQLWRTAGALALIASLETLLCVDAVDRLDRFGRSTPRDRELLGQGVGNLLCGLFAALPISGVIVRSATNAHAGATTRRSVILQGLMLCVAMVALPDLLSLVPLASLAVVLIVVGLRLARPILLAARVERSASYRVPFAMTALGVLFGDLLVGVGIGLATALAFLVVRQYRNAVFVTDDGPLRLIRLRSDLAFVHKPLLSRALEVRGSQGVNDVVVDGSRVRHMDEDVIELLRAAQRDGVRGAKVTVLRNPNNTHPFFRDEELLP